MLFSQPTLLAALAYSLTFNEMSNPTKHLRWGDELRSIDLPHDTAESPALAFHAPSNLYAISHGSKIEFRDASWNIVRAVSDGFTAPESIRFDPSGEYLVAAYSLHTERRHDELLRIFKVQTAGNAAGTVETPKLDLIDEVVRKTEHVLQDLAGWSSEDTSAVRDSLVKGTSNTIATIYTQRDVKNKIAMKAQLPSFQASPFSNDGRLLYAMTDRNEVSVTDVRTREVLFKLSHPLLERTSPEKRRGGWVNNEAIMWVGQSPDSTIFATTSWDATVVLWNAYTGAKLHQLKGPKSQNWGGVFARDSTWFAAGSGDRNVYVWDTATGELKATLSGFKGWIRALTVTSDGKRMAAGSEGGSIIEFDTRNWSKIWAYNVGKLDSKDEEWSMVEVIQLQYEKLDSRLIARISDERLYVFAEEGELLLRVDPDYSKAADLGNGWSQRAMVLPGNKEFMCLGGDGKLRFWPL